MTYKEQYQNLLTTYKAKLAKLERLDLELKFLEQKLERLKLLSKQEQKKTTSKKKSSSIPKLDLEGDVEVIG